MITDNNSEHEKPEEFEDEESLKAEYAELYDKMKNADAEHETEFVEPSPEEKAKSMKLAFDCVKIGDSMRAQDIKVLDVTGKSSIADFIVLMTGYNKRQIQGIANEIEKEMKKQKMPIGGVEGYDISWWILVDLNNVIVHIFYEDARQYYELDTLLQDATVIFEGDAENLENVDDYMDETDETSTMED